MDKLLADLALTDQALEAIRHWLLALRDGRTRVAPELIVIHNSRSERDPPARLAFLRAEGNRPLPPSAGCHVGVELAGGTRCEIKLAGSGPTTLAYRFADSPGLQPQPVRVAARTR